MRIIALYSHLYLLYVALTRTQCAYYRHLQQVGCCGGAVPVKANGDLSNYTPDFIVWTTDGTVWVVETKGREEIDEPQKMARLRQW